MCNKTKNKNKKYFCKYCLQSFSSEKILVEHKKSFLKINGKQNLKLKSGSIKSKNHFKQLVVPLKIYADFGCNMKELVVVIEIILHTLKNIKNMPCSFTYKVVCIVDEFSKPVVLYSRKMQFID